MKALIIVLFLLLASVSNAQTSKLYVVETVGNVKMIVDSKYQESVQATAYPAPGTAIITGEKSRQVVVYSNGVGMYVGSESMVLVRSYIQQPFSNLHDTYAMEPSITRGQTMVGRGIVGICTGNLLAGTMLQYTTPNANVNLYTSRVVIKFTGTGTQVYLFEGKVTVENHGLSKKIDRQPDLVKPNEVAFIDLDGNITISPMEDKDKKELEQCVTSAWEARTRVLFGMLGDAAGAESEIKAFPTVPNKLNDNIVVSPSRVISP